MEDCGGGRLKWRIAFWDKEVKDCGDRRRKWRITVVGEGGGELR